MSLFDAMKKALNVTGTVTISDLLIQQRDQVIKSALGADPALKILAIDAAVTDGAVTLYGTANNRALREKAAQVASKVEGVKSVRNELVIVAGS